MKVILDSEAVPKNLRLALMKVILDSEAVPKNLRVD